MKSVAANQTGVTITFQNKTFQGIHVAVFLYSISVDSSAKDASYELGDAPCGTGLVLTIGDLPYAGPLAYGQVQLIGVILNNVIALAASTIACIALRFYWTRSKNRYLLNECRKTLGFVRRLGQHLVGTLASIP